MLTVYLTKKKRIKVIIILYMQNGVREKGTVLERLPISLGGLRNYWSWAQSE